jgi:hypothetical protein
MWRKHRMEPNVCHPPWPVIAQNTSSLTALCVSSWPTAQQSANKRKDRIGGRKMGGRIVVPVKCSMLTFLCLPGSTHLLRQISGCRGYWPHDGKLLASLSNLLPIPQLTLVSVRTDLNSNWLASESMALLSSLSYMGHPLEFAMGYVV